MIATNSPVSDIRLPNPFGAGIRTLVLPSHAPLSHNVQIGPVECLQFTPDAVPSRETKSFEVTLCFRCKKGFKPYS